MAKIPIIFEDNYLMVVNKPAGFVVDPSVTQKNETLADILQKDFEIKLERGGIVHRLDKDTSGLLLVAKTKETLENLQSQFASRTIKKEYTALVHGFLEKPRTVIGAIERNPQNREKFAVLEGGKEAQTFCEPIKKLQITNDKLQIIFSDFNKIQMRKLFTVHYSLFTLVTCRPITGRTHQIRVHLKYIGHPIVSDEKYGGRKTVRLDKRWCPRQFLHASSIEFRHPKSGQVVICKSELPEDLKEAFNLLES